MTDTPSPEQPRPAAPIGRWLSDPVPPEVDAALARLARTPGVRRIAVMPDVHLASLVCVGVVAATDGLLIPHAVGGDIGCGMAAMALDADARSLNEPCAAEAVLSRLYRVTPVMRQPRDRMRDLSPELDPARLSHPALGAVARRDGRTQLGTLGRGNHFLEVQADDDGRLWLMVHSGSRAMGQAITEHHLRHCHPAASALPVLDADSAAGRAYLNDVEWGVAYARQNRRCMLEAACALLEEELGVRSVAGTYFDADHNHVRVESHDGVTSLVHRKGANAAFASQAAMIPGSMGTSSFHVEGRGLEAALCSSSHGAGRALDRTTARRSFSVRDLHRQMRGIWFDPRVADRLRDEAPGSYKDILGVMRAQQTLVRIVRRLRPVLCYKGG